MSWAGVTGSHVSWPDSLCPEPPPSPPPVLDLMPASTSPVASRPTVPPWWVRALSPLPGAPASLSTSSLPFQLCGSGLDILITSPSPAWNTNSPKMKPSVFNFFKSQAERKDKKRGGISGWKSEASSRLFLEPPWAAGFQCAGLPATLDGHSVPADGPVQCHQPPQNDHTAPSLDQGGGWPCFFQ